MSFLKRREAYRDGTRLTSLGPDPVHVVSYRQDLQDSVSGFKGQDNPFASAGFFGTGALHYGKLGAVGDFNGAPSGLYASVLPFMGHGLSGPPADINALLARTNPATPKIQLPVFWVELRDIPNMLREIGLAARAIYFNRVSPSALLRDATDPKTIAAIHIAIQFGWRPFVGDLWKIVSLQDAVERRRKELKKLTEGHGLSKRADFGQTSVTSKEDAPANSDFGAFVSTQIDYTFTTKVWGVARWKPTDGGSIPASTNALRRQLSGLSPDAILTDVWEALPWSWLVDWFTGIGNIIQAGNRTIATPVSVCIMTERRTRAISKPRVIAQDPMNPYILETGQFYWWSHQRAVQADSFSQTAALPILGAGQLSILASLAVLKAR